MVMDGGAARVMLASLLGLASLLHPAFPATEPQTHLSYQAADEIQAGDVIGRVAQDARLGERYPSSVLVDFQFTVLKGTLKAFFEIDTYEGILTASELIDRDDICRQRPNCDIELDIALIRPPQYFQIIKVTVTLMDENDHAPVFSEVRTELAVSENALPGVSFVLPNAIDPDSPAFGIQSYVLQDPSGTFALQIAENVVDVRLRLVKRLNRERQESYSMRVLAKDGGRPPLTGSMEVDVLVQDANDHSPVFDKAVYNVSIREDARPSTVLLVVSATDADHGLNSQIRYGLSGQTSAAVRALFGIEPHTGQVFLKDQLDYERETSYSLQVIARDLGPDSVEGHAKVVVHVLDVNDYVPVISVNLWNPTGAVVLRENADPGEFVAHISVEDLDKGPSGDVTCQVIESDLFAMESLYGNAYKLFAKVTFDREQLDHVVATITCQDGGQPPLGATKELSVQILDENDNDPVFDESVYSLDLRENTPLLTPILQLTARDRDIGENGDVMYHVGASSQHIVTVDPTSGILTVSGTLDRERMEHLDFSVLAMDGGEPARSATASVRITIQDVNDAAPTFQQASYNFATFENNLPGTEIGVVSAKDSDVNPDFNQFVYSLVRNDTFRIDPLTGAIFTRKVLDRELQWAYHVTVVATDIQPPYLSSTANVTVVVADQNDNAPMIQFPSEHNNTFVVSAFAPHGFVITTVLAQDADHESNARLSYSIAKGNHEGYFGINSRDGVLTVQRRLASDPDDENDDDENDRFQLLLMVQDQQDPDLAKSAVIDIYILVNRTKAFARTMGLNPDGRADGREFLGFYEKILIIVGAVTLVLVAILITAILCIRKRLGIRERDSYKYMCRIDLAQQLASMAQDGGLTSAESTPPDSPMKTIPDQKKSVSFDLRDSGLMGSNFSGSMSDVSNGSQVLLEITGYLADCPETAILDSPEEPPELTPETCPIHGKAENRAKMQHVLDMLKVDPEPHRDSDSTSGCSADMSNSDSGRGHSEEGDHHSNGQAKAQHPQDGSHSNPGHASQQSAAGGGGGGCCGGCGGGGDEQYAGCDHPPHPHKPRTKHDRGVRYVTCPLRCGAPHLPKRSHPTPPGLLKVHPGAGQSGGGQKTNSKTHPDPPPPIESLSSSSSSPPPPKAVAAKSPSSPSRSNGGGGSLTAHTTGCHGNRPNSSVGSTEALSTPPPPPSPSSEQPPKAAASVKNDRIHPQRPLQLKTFGYNGGLGVNALRGSAGAVSGSPYPAPSRGTLRADCGMPHAVEA